MTHRFNISRKLNSTRRLHRDVRTVITLDNYPTALFLAFAYSPNEFAGLAYAT